MGIQASGDTHSNLQFKSASGEDFYYESGVGTVKVPAASATGVCRLRTEPGWEFLRSVVPFVAVAVYRGDHLDNDARVGPIGSQVGSSQATDCPRRRPLALRPCVDEVEKELADARAERDARIAEASSAQSTIGRLPGRSA